MISGMWLISMVPIRWDCHATNNEPLHWSKCSHVTFTIITWWTSHMWRLSEKLNITQPKQACITICKVITKQQHSLTTASFQGQSGQASTRKTNHSNFNEARGSRISWTICQSFASCYRHITVPAAYHLFFTGQMLFMTHNQQCQSTEGKKDNNNNKCNELNPGLATLYNVWCGVWNWKGPVLTTMGSASGWDCHFAERSSNLQQTQREATNGCLLSFQSFNAGSSIRPCNVQHNQPHSSSALHSLPLTSLPQRQQRLSLGTQIQRNVLK